ncbi:MAG: hypothetical protein PHZ00_05690 [Candidatus Peribacteraceae bacterium]|nr:hypothetical protein [Candidatus Peribacteraceae bacterium]
MPKFASLIRWIGIATLLLLLWTLYNWPALVHVWWLFDDLVTVPLYPMSHTLIRSVTQGRPIGIFLFLLNYILMNWNLTAAFFILHILQAILHVTAAMLIGKILIHFSRTRAAFIAVLPFLLWPFGNEATLWIAATLYPLAACLSLGGILLLIDNKKVSFRRRLAGMFLISIAPFCVQPASLAGLSVYCIALALSILDRERLSILLRACPYILIAYVLGIAGNAVLPFLLHDSHTLGTDPATALLYQSLPQIVAGLKYLLTHPAFYPQWLVKMHIATLALGIISFVIFPAARTIREYTINTSIVLFLVFSFLFILRLPTILLGLFWFSGRTMYFDPLLLTFALCLVLRSRMAPTFGAIIVSFIVLILAIGYFPISITYAREHVVVFQRDRETLKGLEEIAGRQQIGQLVVAYDPASYPVFNPYSLRYPGFGEVNQSVFTTGWYLPYFLALFSDTLQLQQDPAEQAPCLAVCAQDINSQRRSVHVLEKPKPAVCLCP